MSRDLLEKFIAEPQDRIYEQLVQLYRPLVYSVCRRYLREAADIDDAVQETFLKFSVRLGSINGSVSAWLASVASNTSLDLIRSRTRESRRRQDMAMMSSAQAPHELVHELIRHHLQQALLQLDESSREFLVARFFRKTPLRLIAADMNTSIATASRRISDALSALAAILRDMGVESADDATLAEHFDAPLPGMEDSCNGNLRFAPDWQAAGLRCGISSRPEYLPGWNRPLRVGIFIGYETIRIYGVRNTSVQAEQQAHTAGSLRHPGLQLVTIVEPGTGGYGPIERTMRDCELLGGLIDVTDVESLKTLDVIIFSNNFSISSVVLRAMVEAVESGVGLLKEFWCGHIENNSRHADPYVCKLLLADSPIYSFHMPRYCGEQVPLVVESEHPLLPGLKRGDTFRIGGCSPIYRVVPGAAVPLVKDRWVLPEEHQITGLGPIRPPAFIVGRLGQGRVVVIHDAHVPGVIQNLGLGRDYLTTLLAWLADPNRQRD